MAEGRGGRWRQHGRPFAGPKGAGAEDSAGGQEQPRAALGCVIRVSTEGEGEPEGEAM